MVDVQFRAALRQDAGRSRLPRVLLVAAWYPLCLVAGTVLLDAQPVPRRDAWLAWASTDLANLTERRPPLVHAVGSLAASGLLCEGDLVAWAVLALIGLATLGQRLGAGAAAVVVVAVHVVATLVTQGMAAVRIASGVLSPSARVMSDVGPSYLVVAALIGGIACGALWGRVFCACGFALLAPSLFDGLTQWDVAAVGHVVSILLAAGLVTILMVRGRRRAPTVNPGRGTVDA
jgi:hypothetical protein